MLFLPAAALSCLCSALVAMAAGLIQGDLTLTRNVGENVSFSCLGQCGYIHWFQKRDTETFTGILRIWTDDEPVVKPVVSVYPAASRAHLEGQSSLLCLASAMFPPLVRFSWKRRKENGSVEELLPAEWEQLELRESGHNAAILFIHQQENNTYKYRCYVHHEGGTVEAQTEQGIPGMRDHGQGDNLCSSSPTPGLPVSSDTVSFQFQWRVKLLCALYTVLIVKVLVYCCGLSLLMILRNKPPSTNCCTHDD